MVSTGFRVRDFRPSPFFRWFFFYPQSSDGLDRGLFLVFQGKLDATAPCEALPAVDFFYILVEKRQSPLGARIFGFLFCPPSQHLLVFFLRLGLLSVGGITLPPHPPGACSFFPCALFFFLLSPDPPYRFPYLPLSKDHYFPRLAPVQSLQDSPLSRVRGSRFSVNDFLL